MPDTPQLLIEGSEQILALFGRWPTFHDSEVLQLLLTRADAPTALIRISAVERSRETDSAGFYKAVFECIIGFELRNLRDLEIAGFNHQNVLAEIVFSHIPADARESFEITFAGLHGIHARFQCESVRVTEVTLVK